MSDDVRAGEELARAWLQGNSELLDDLADLVGSMSHPLDETARTFLLTVGNAARQASKGKARPAHERIEAQPAVQPTPPAPIDLNEVIRRRREHELAARLEELGRRNAQAWVDQAQMVRGLDWGL
jgi:hypothetical protein